MLFGALIEKSKLTTAATLVLLGLTACGGVEDSSSTGSTDASFVQGSTDYDSFENIIIPCAERENEGWCREGEGRYRLKMAPSSDAGTVQALSIMLEPEVLVAAEDISSSSTSSSSSSSNSSTSSSSSSGLMAGAASSSSSSGVIKPFAHAPSEAWIIGSGWEFAPGSYQPSEAAIALRDSEAFVNDEQVQHRTTRLPIAPSQRGQVFRLTGEFRSTTPASVDLDFNLSDNVLVLASETSAATRDIAYDLTTATVGSDWTDVSATFEFWSSVVLNLFVGADAGEFSYRNLKLEMVGEGELSDNPMLLGANANNSLRPVQWFINQGWTMQYQSLYAPHLIYMQGSIYPNEPLTGEHGPFEEVRVLAVYQERGQPYLASVYVRSADGSPVDVNFGFVDSAAVASATDNYDISHMTYELGSANVAGEEWQLITGTYIHQGSSGFEVQLIADEGEFIFKDLVIEDVAP